MDKNDIVSVLSSRHKYNTLTVKLQIPLVASRHDTLSSQCILVQEKVVRTVCRKSVTRLSRLTQLARQARLDERDMCDTQLSLVTVQTSSATPDLLLIQ